MVQPALVSETYEPPAHCLTLTRYFYTPVERPEGVLTAQLQEAERRLAHVVVAPLQAHQREALLCLVSDLVSGLSAAPSVTFEKSVLVQTLNLRMFQIAAAEFFTFCYAEGKVQTRLWEKRKAESFLFTRGHLLFE